MPKITFAVVLLFACGGSSAPSAEKFATSMTSTQEPSLKVPSTGSGTASFTNDGTSVSYTLTATGLTGPATAAHIHTGAVGVSGPIVVPLKADAGTGANSVSAAASFTAADITGKNPDGGTMSMDDLLTQIRAGNAYVNVHTSANSGGEVRGQLAKQ